MIAFDFDPCEILGVGRGASLQEIRDAYRKRAKLYHPDTGGEAWAFRVVSRAYESLCQARVVSRAYEDQTRASPEAASPRAEPIRVPDAAEGGTHRSVTDRVANPSQLVAAETLIVRFEEDNFHYLLLRPAEERNLSCTLQVQWPIAELVPRRDEIAGAERLLRGVGRAFEGVEASTRPISSRSSVEDGRFSGWLTYPAVVPVSEALQRLRSLLTPEGMGVQHTIRDHHVPRDWVG
jgi:DnaJ domain